MNKQVRQEEPVAQKSPGKFQVFLMIFLIPAIFLAVASLGILTVLDINLFDKAKEAGISIPFITQEGEEKTGAEKQTSDQKIVTLQTQNKEKEAEISKLESEIVSQQDENEQLLTEQERLIDEMETLRQQQETESKEFDEIVSVFEEMSGKASAPIILEMTDSESVKILSQLSPDSLAKVFEKLPPVEAARYTELLSVSTP
ncbi:MotE family protein [Jeotgalibacillus marinus]|uniref:Magnesium transporter MgtE intracellular domain-containing protein n=1 Tax=Jeotgalibacillus marinus TaxID=86667 RepID=A0ABV3Q1T0_9BACL